MTIIPIVPVQAAPAEQAASAADTDAATQFFRNYTRREARVPMAVWWVARGAVLLVALSLAACLLWQPALGLQLFWGLAIPVVPALLVVAPGLWRQVCPMATLNQLPRLAGFARGLDLPPALKTWAFAISVAVFLVAVSLRAPLLNHSGPLVATVVIGALLLALAGGVVFKGRSGWCGTFCPLAPVQRTYGQAPLVVVKNGYCNPCVGCQKSCYDFNPRAAVFSDVYDDDPRHAAQRRLFMGLLPGLILGYFLLGPTPSMAAPAYMAMLAAACCASAGAYGLAVAFLPANPYRVALFFGALALSAFYWFAGPIVVRTVSSLLQVQAAPMVTAAAQGVGVVLALVLAGAGLYAEARYRVTQRKRAPVPAANAAAAAGGVSLKERLAAVDSAEVTDRSSGISFPVASDATLLEALQGAGLKINFGCRAGVCGADPVAVCEGAEHLSPPGEDELATLRRLGLEGRARLACMCTVRGPVLIDRNPHSAPALAAPAGPVEAVEDKALALGLQRVVVVGNGVSGMGVAEALRRASPSVDITVVGNEPFAFYNRMGIGRLVYDSAGLEALQLVPPDWPDKFRVQVLRGAVAMRVDPAERQLHLHSGQVLPYDKLVLATGASSLEPDPRFAKAVNAFVLRSAEDAQGIRYYVGRAKAKRAVVVGGGVLGVEAADALHHLGLKVTLLQRADRLMNQQLDAAGAAKLQGYLESIGIQVVTGVTVSGYEVERGLLRQAQLAHGPRVRADLFVAALGIQANSFLGEQAGLALGDNGIKVDACMRTSDPHIYAVGDVAELRGTPRGLWPIGAAHAATAVSSMLGDAVPYATPRIVLQLKCDGIDLRSQGDITPREGDEDFHARPEDEAWWRLVVRHGQLAGGLYVGPPGTAKAFTKLLQQPVDLGPLRAELRAGRLQGLAQRLAQT